MLDAALQELDRNGRFLMNIDAESSLPSIMLSRNWTPLADRVDGKGARQRPGRWPCTACLARILFLMND